MEEAPSLWPTGYQLDSVLADPARQTLCLLFRFHADENYPALIVYESPTGLPEVKEMQAAALYDGRPVEISADYEHLMISGADFERGSLVTTGLQPSNLCGGKETHANRALIWSRGGRSYILFSSLDQLDGRGYLTRREIIRLAEDLNGFPQKQADEPDPERLLSIEEAEKISNRDLKAPSRMLASLQFNHFSLQQEGPYRPSEEEVLAAMLYTGLPVGDGRTYRAVFFQIFNPQNTLESLALAGGYRPAAVRGNPGIYRQDCWGLEEPGAGCVSSLIWFENAVQYEFEVHLPGFLPEAVLIDIAESVR